MPSVANFGNFITKKVLVGNPANKGAFFSFFSSNLGDDHDVSFGDTGAAQLLY